MDNKTPKKMTMQEFLIQMRADIRKIVREEMQLIREEMKSEGPSNEGRSLTEVLSAPRSSSPESIERFKKETVSTEKKPSKTFSKTPWLNDVLADSARRLKTDFEHGVDF